MKDPMEMIKFFAVNQAVGKRYQEGKVKNLYTAWCNNTGYGYDETDVEAGFYGGFGLALDKVLKLIENAHFDLDDSSLERDVYMRVSEYRKWMKKVITALKGGEQE